MKTGGAITVFNPGLALLLLLLLQSGTGTAATEAAMDGDVQHYTYGFGMWVCTAYARPGPINRTTCDWMCRQSKSSTAGGGAEVRLGDYDCCDKGCRCSFCVFVITDPMGNAAAAAAISLWPIAVSSSLVLMLLL